MTWIEELRKYPALWTPAEKEKLLEIAELAKSIDREFPANAVLNNGPALVSARKLKRLRAALMRLLALLIVVPLWAASLKCPSGQDLWRVGLHKPYTQTMPYALHRLSQEGRVYLQDGNSHVLVCGVALWDDVASWGGHIYRDLELLKPKVKTSARGKK
jgi:hypothetical protein